jgi:hypothetical protein
MERSETPFQLDAQQPTPSPAAIQLAAILAAHLDGVVPDAFRVRAEDDRVALYRGDAFDSDVGVAAALDQEVDPQAAAGERHSFAWFAAMVSESVLSSVQDGVSEATAEPWPPLSRGRMAYSGARRDGESVYLWYGPDYEREAEAVIVFPPILVVDLLHRTETRPGAA